MSSTVVRTTALALAAAGTLAASTLAPQPQTASAATTRAGVVSEIKYAMDTEAFAYAQYNAYADNAASRPVAQRSWRTVADVEYWDHFVTESKLVNLAGNNKSNLRAAIAAESSAMTNYATWAKQARAEGCTSVADTFTQIRQDEVDHHAWFQQALAAYTKGGTIPAPPTVDAVAVTPHSATCNQPETMKALDAAMHSESLSWGEYTQWAQHAVNTGQPKLAALFDAIGNVELQDHWATEANLVGFVSPSINANLRTSAASEVGAVAMYTGIIRDAKAVGWTTAVTDLTGVRSDERGHLRTFRALLG